MFNNPMPWELHKVQEKVSKRTGNFEESLLIYGNMQKTII